MGNKGILLREEYGFTPKNANQTTNSKKNGGNKNDKNKKEKNK